jgi:hypothetical protein
MDIQVNPVPGALMPDEHRPDWLAIVFCGLLLGVFLSSCGSKEEGPAEHYYRVGSEEGVTAYITSGVPKYSEPLFRYVDPVQLVQDESRPESLLYRAFSYYRGDDGRFYVRDAGNSRIAVFDEDGQYSHQIGREGDGPGEFRSPMVLWIQNNKIAISDSRHRRTSLFTCDGEFLGSYVLTKGVPLGNRIFPLEDGRLVCTGTQYVPLPDRAMERWYVGTVLSAEGDTLAQVETTHVRDEPPIMLEDARIGIGRIKYFDTRAVLQYVPGRGFIKYETAEPILRWFDLEGQLSGIVRIERKRDPVTDADR